jgi:starch-binding outer membrane protein, SusD/RagB family
VFNPVSNLITIRIMKKLQISRLLIVFFTVMVIPSCNEEFLEVKPNGSLSEHVLANKEGLETVLIGAYSMLDGVSANGFGWEAATSNWLYGSVLAGEANKGSDAGDASDMNSMINYSTTAENAYLNVKWRSVYEGVSRSNAVLVVLESATEINEEDRIQYTAEARALRGFYHFEAKRMWNMVPYVDETLINQQVANDKDIWPMIESDFEYAYNNLPVSMDAIGRINKWVAGAFLSKVYIYQKKFDEALPILKAIIDEGQNPLGVKYALLPKYGDVFDIVNRNSSEAVFTVQYSVNDGSGGWNGGWGEVLNFPYKSGGSPGGCCGFFQPNHEFVNSFRTESGLPLPEWSYNTAANALPADDGVNASSQWLSGKIYYEGEFVTRVEASEPYRDRVYRAIDDMDGIGWEPVPADTDPLNNPSTWKLVYLEPSTTAVDPRLDWTVGRRGLPYLDWGDHTGSDWIRDPTYGGPFTPKKQVYKKSQEGVYTEVGNWTAGWTANGYRMIRFAEILLLAAECEIEVGSLEQARTYVNMVRERAANPEGFVKNADNSDAANYEISPYPAASFATKENARKALYFERKLELGMEGHRFFDLARWGKAKEEIDNFLAYERIKRPSMYEQVIFEEADIYFPIPQRQIDLSAGKLVQTR